MQMVKVFISKSHDELNKKHQELVEMFESDDLTPPTFLEFCQLEFITTMVEMSKDLTEFISHKGLASECHKFIETGELSKKLSPEDEINKMVGDLGLSIDTNNNLNYN